MVSTVRVLGFLSIVVIVLWVLQDDVPCVEKARELFPITSVGFGDGGPKEEHTYPSIQSIMLIIESGEQIPRLTHTIVFRQQVKTAA